MIITPFHAHHETYSEAAAPGIRMMQRRWDSEEILLSGLIPSWLNADHCNITPVLGHKSQQRL